VEILRERGITDDRVLAAIGAVPRHLFVEPALRGRAYEDEALPIGLNQTISQPFTVAYQTMLLAPQKDDRVLEVGTGSGYQAAVLCELGARVFTIERHKTLLDRTLGLLDALGYRVVARHGDGTLGWPSFAPYDGIVVTAGAADVPRPLLAQLRVDGEGGRPGGRLVIPVGDLEGQMMNRITRGGPDQYEREETHVFRFVPLVGRGGLKGNVE
jgi:protein-L-isoaspartate(D-aspartate) O-methyltransferase